MMPSSKINWMAEKYSHPCVVEGFLTNTSWQKNYKVQDQYIIGDLPAVLLFKYVGCLFKCVG